LVFYFLCVFFLLLLLLGQLFSLTHDFLFCTELSFFVVDTCLKNKPVLTWMTKKCSSVKWANFSGV
jgi:hypothetical protein